MSIHIVHSPMGSGFTTLQACTMAHMKSLLLKILHAYEDSKSCSGPLGLPCMFLVHVGGQSHPWSSHGLYRILGWASSCLLHLAEQSSPGRVLPHLQWHFLFANCKLQILTPPCLSWCLSQRILAVHYQIPPQLRISPDCQDLLARVFVANPMQRISLEGIQQHPWFLKNLPAELANPGAAPIRWGGDQEGHVLEAWLRLQMCF